MSELSARFIKSSLIYFLAGALVGLVLSIPPVRFFINGFPARYGPMHSHLMLLGFVSMMIYGVAYHALPRFVGNLLYSASLGWAHFWIANVATVGMAIGFLIPGDNVVLAIFATLQVIGIVIFGYNLWRTINLKEG